MTRARPGPSLLLLAALTALALLAPAGVARAQMPQTAPSDVPAAPDYFTEVRGNPLDYEDLADHVFASSASQGTSIPRLADGRMHLERTQTMDVAWVYAGFAPGAFAIGTEGLALPVDADRYTAASFRAWSPVRTTAAILFDKCGPDAGRCTGSSQNFFIEPGWRTYQVPLVSGGPSGWNGRVAEVRLTVAGDGTPHELQVDWVRLYRPTAAVPVRAIGSQLYWDADDDQANNTPENPGWGLLAEGPAVLTATFPADAYPPGTYRFFTEMGPAQTGPITVGAPLPVLLDPDAAGGDDYATVETGDAWDFSQPSDVTHLENVGALDWSGGRLSTVNGGADPSNSFMDLRLGAPVDTSRYHRLTVVTELQGAFDLGFGAGGGSHGRLLWHGDQSGSTFIHNSKEVVLYPFLSEYTVDLATDPGSAVHETDDPARPGWTGLVDRVRWDPNEDPGPRAWYIDELRLAADDETSGGFFDVRWEDRSTTATDGTTVSLYYDTDGAGFDGRAIATDVEQVDGENVVRWDARGIAPGTYHVYVEARRGEAVTRRYATGPLVVSGLGVAPSGSDPTTSQAAPTAPTAPTSPTAPADEPAGSDQRGFDGDPSSIERIAGSTPATIAANVSVARFAEAGAGRGEADGRAAAAHAVLTRDDAFPDALAGAPLAADGPLLTTRPDALPDVTLRELRRVLAPGGTVYLLGGERAISASVGARLDDLGYVVRRLSGPSRVETALAVADEVRRLSPGSTVVLARAYGTESDPTSGWADSVTGGAWAAAEGVPVLVTGGEAVHPALRAWLDREAPDSTVMLGGRAALSDEVEAGVPGPRRVAGPDRAATAADVARDLWGDRGDGLRAFEVIHAYRADGWVHGLSAAGLAADQGAPILVVGDDVPGATAELVRSCGRPRADLLLVGDERVISGAVADDLGRAASGC